MIIDNRHQLTEEQSLRLKDLQNAIGEKPELFDRFHKITQGHGPFSSRLIEFVCVHYARNHRTRYQVNIGDSKVVFRLHDSYNEWLDYWKKRNFDIYTRKYTMKYKFTDGNMYKTNVAQLNFVYWMMLHNVDDFIERSIDDIRNQKARFCSESRIRKRQAAGNKRRLQSAPATTHTPLDSLCTPPTPPSRSESSSHPSQCADSQHSGSQD